MHRLSHCNQRPNSVSGVGIIDIYYYATCWRYSPNRTTHTIRCAVPAYCDSQKISGMHPESKPDSRSVGTVTGTSAKCNCALIKLVHFITVDIHQVIHKIHNARLIRDDVTCMPGCSVGTVLYMIYWSRGTRKQISSSHCLEYGDYGCFLRKRPTIKVAKRNLLIGDTTILLTAKTYGNQFRCRIDIQQFSDALHRLCIKKRYENKTIPNNTGTVRKTCHKLWVTFRSLNNALAQWQPNAYFPHYTTLEEQTNKYSRRNDSTSELRGIITTDAIQRWV